LLFKVETHEGGFEELNNWLREMKDCDTVDPGYTSAYFANRYAIILEHATRLMNFIGHHNLYKQFLSEDAQGKR
jgi:hypothetical protein